MESSLLYFITFLYIAAIYAQKFPYDKSENELTITINPGERECFYQKVKVGNTLEIEYQVIDAIFGEVELQQDLDVTFSLFSPQGRELMSDYKQSDAAHRHEVKEDGDYKFCFDNSYSHFSKKIVYFEVYVDTGLEDYKDDWDEFQFSPELLYNDTVDQIKMSIAKVRNDLNAIKHHQDQLKAMETRDRNLQEHNFTRVNQFSMFIIFLMVAVGTVQVIMVRSLFEEHSKLHKIFRMLS